MSSRQASVALLGSVICLIALGSFRTLQVDVAPRSNVDDLPMSRAEPQIGSSDHAWSDMLVQMLSDRQRRNEALSEGTLKTILALMEPCTSFLCHEYRVPALRQLQRLKLEYVRADARRSWGVRGIPHLFSELGLVLVGGVEQRAGEPRRVFVENVGGRCEPAAADVQLWWRLVGELEIVAGMLEAVPSSRCHWQVHSATGCGGLLSGYDVAGVGAASASGHVQARREGAGPPAAPRTFTSSGQ